MHWNHLFMTLPLRHVIEIRGVDMTRHNTRDTRQPVYVHHADFPCSCNGARHMPRLSEYLMHDSHPVCVLTIAWIEQCE